MKKWNGIFYFGARIYISDESSSFWISSVQREVTVIIIMKIQRNGKGSNTENIFISDDSEELNEIIWWALYSDSILTSIMTLVLKID